MLLYRLKLFYILLKFLFFSRKKIIIINMGEHLSKPVIDKVSSDNKNDKVIYGASSMQGWRVSQENAHNCFLDFDTNTSFFAVYDGHGGREVAQYTSEKFPEILKNLDTYKNGDIKNALIKAFLDFDSTIATPEVVSKLLKTYKSHDKKTTDNVISSSNDVISFNTTHKGAGFIGCTAVVALLKGNELYVANAGDSRCVVCRNGEAIEMSFDHKPYIESERERVVKAGGEVDDGRINGALNLSRAFGDHCYKQNKRLSNKEQMITALPDVRSLTLNPAEDEFLILACDGIWNSMPSQKVIDFVRPRLKKNGEKLSTICEEMFDHCLGPDYWCEEAGIDNMTAIIVQFKRNLFESSANLQYTERQRSVYSPYTSINRQRSVKVSSTCLERSMRSYYTSAKCQHHVQISRIANCLLHLIKK